MSRVENLKKEIEDLVDTYFYPPFGWSVNSLGILKYGDKLEAYCNFNGQGIAEPIYNGTAEYVIELKDEIENYFDVSSRLSDYPKKEVKENINFIVEDVKEKIKEFEENND